MVDASFYLQQIKMYWLLFFVRFPSIDHVFLP